MAEQAPANTPNAPGQDEMRAREVLWANQHMDWVQRVLEPQNQPVIQNQDGSHSTHLMAWDGPDKNGVSYVYPTIIRDPSSGQLIQLDPHAAFKYAMLTGDHITFDNPKDAAWFSEHYKLGWGAGKVQTRSGFKGLKLTMGTNANP